jgi:hypothetical protein
LILVPIEETFCCILVCYLEGQLPIKLIPLIMFVDLEQPHSPLSFHDVVLETFKTFFSDFITWLCDPGRHGNVFIISKSSLIDGETWQRFPIMQATLRICHEVQRQGSRVLSPSQENDWIQEICEGLVMRYRPYRRLLAQQLKDDPTIFDRLSVRLLLRKLIIKPWMAVRDAHPIYAANPPVIFLHFQNPYRGSEEQDVLELINEYCHNKGPHCLLWVVSCRWAPDFSPLISKVFHQSPSRYHHRTAFIGTDEAERYTEKVLRINLAEVVKRHPYLFHADEIWPPEEDLRCLSKAASGDESFMELLVRFIHLGACQGGPRERLQKCLNYITGLPRPTPKSPHLPLILFYDRAISCLFTGSFPHAIHVMECIYNHYVEYKPSAPRIAQLLDMDQEHVDLALSQFQWTLRRENSNEYDFLDCARHLIDESHRQGRSLVARTSVQIVESYFRIWSKSPFSSMIPKHRPRRPEDPGLAVARRISFTGNSIASRELQPWMAFLYCEKEEEQTLVRLSRGFDFRRLVHCRSAMDYFPHFLGWLYVR